jgi:sugar lactone lactonase YvrE
MAASAAYRIVRDRETDRRENDRKELIMRIAPRALWTATLAFALAAPSAGCGDDDDDGGGGGDDDTADAGTGADAGGGADAAPSADAGVGDAITLPGDAVYPEGVTSLADGTIFVGSANQGTIFRVPPGARSPESEPFAEAGDNGLVNTIGLYADEARGTLWACSSDLAGTSGIAPGLKAFDLATGEPAGSFDFPGGGFCNDIAIDADGNVYATDSFAARILTLPVGGTELEVWIEDDRFGGEGFNLNGIEVDGDAVLTVKSNTGELFRIPIGENGAAGEPLAVALDRALESPDGLRREDTDTFIVVEGVGRLTRIALDGVAPQLTALREDLNGPTTATIVGGDVWVVEGQIVHLSDPTTGPPDLPFQLVRVPRAAADRAARGP